MDDRKPENLTEKNTELKEIATMEALVDKADINVIRMWEKR